MCMSQEHGAATQGVGAGPDVLRINAETQRKATGENLGGWAERTQGLKPGKMAPQSLKQSSPEMTPIPSSGYFLHVVSASKCRLLFLVLLSLKHLIFFYLYMCANMCDFWSWNEGGYGPYYVGSRSQTPKLCKSSQRSSPQSHLSSPTSIFFIVEITHITTILTGSFYTSYLFGGMHAMAHKWGSEDSFGESVFSSTMWISGIELRLSGWLRVPLFTEPSLWPHHIYY